MSSGDKPESYFPLAGLANDGWSTDDEATATCYCGTVQLKFVSRVSSLSMSSCQSRMPLAVHRPIVKPLLMHI